jgi:hypothetical protein
MIDKVRIEKIVLDGSPVVPEITWSPFYMKVTTPGRCGSCVRRNLV